MEQLYGDIEFYGDEIPQMAYYDQKRITGVTIGEGTKTIKFAAFKGCSNMRYVNIPDSVKEIEDEAFVGCESLKVIIIPKNCKIR